MKNIKSIAIAAALIIAGVATYIYNSKDTTDINETKAPVEAKIAGVDVALSDAEQKSWDMQTSQPIAISELPISNSMGEVATTPESRQIVSLPMNVTVHNILVNRYANVKNGDVLATVSSPEWLSGQQQLLNASIATSAQRVLANNKNILCNEGVVAKKECIMANSELKIKESELSIAKSLLSSYGASSGTISNIINSSSIKPTFEIRSKISGVITDVNATVGSSVPMLGAMFKIQGKSAVWLETLLNKKSAQMLQANDQVIVGFGANKFSSTVLQIAPSVDSMNQSIRVMLSVPNDVKLLAGTKDAVKIFRSVDGLYQVPKVATTTLNAKQVVFGKVNGGFRVIPLEVVSSDDNFVFIKNAITTPVAMNNVVILKNIIGGAND